MEHRVTLIIASILVLACATRSNSSNISVESQQLPQQHQRSAPNYGSAATLSPVTVQTTSGLLSGIKHDLGQIKNSSIYKFLAVPYAQAPVGSLRFKRPLELKEQSEIMVDASKFGKTCPQYRHLTRFISPLLNIDSEHQTSEDCLNLNVFVPSSVGSIVNEEGNKLEANKQFPVIVWIPGEGFDFADARQFDGSYLAHKTQSIVVTVQYRVGVLGFLHAPKLGISGNMGLFDQIMALKWVQKNIAAFGGDSTRVTLMGRFSGSMSISALITAPKQELIRQNGRLLFNRVALISGIAVDDWIINSKQVERVEQLEKFALSKNYCSKAQLEEGTCLQQIPVEQLLRISDFGWRLVIDNELIGSTGPIEAIKRNQFASDLEGILIGETGQEGTLCLYRHILETHKTNYAKLIEEDRLTSENLYDIIRDDSSTYFSFNMTKANPIESALELMIEEGFTQAQSTMDEKLRDKYLNACSVYMIKSHSNKFKMNILSRNEFADNRMDSSKRPVEIYHYELKYKPTFSLAPEYIKTAAHGDDVLLIFGLIYGQPRRDVNEADSIMTRKMMAYVGNFVHGNNPLLGSNHKTIIEHSNRINFRIQEHEVETSMDEEESGSPIVGSSLIHRNWSSEGQVYQIEFTEKDMVEINRRRNLIASVSASPQQPNNQGAREIKLIAIRNQENIRPNLRLLLIDGQFNNARIQPIVDQTDQQQYQDEPWDIPEIGQQVAATRSQRLLELYKQQLLEESNLWPLRNQRKSYSLRPGQQQQQQQQQTQQQQPQTNNNSMLNESSFLTLLVFSSCIIIFVLMALCIGLCLIIFKSNMQNGNKINRYSTKSTSSCNICDDSHAGSIDCAVLGGTRKDSRGFSNVFAKLRNHNNNNNIPTPAIGHSSQPQCTSKNSMQRSTTANSVTIPTNSANNQVTCINSQQMKSDLGSIHQRINDD